MLLALNLLCAYSTQAAPLPPAQAVVRAPLTPIHAASIADPSAQYTTSTSDQTSNTIPVSDNSTVLDAFPSSDNSADSLANATQQFWLGTPDPDTFQIFYPGGSIHTAESPQGDGQYRFDAEPPTVDEMGTDTNATLEYNVYLPETFSFTKEKSLPGLYGGSQECCSVTGEE
jgi:hypothetical protein